MFLLLKFFRSRASFYRVLEGLLSSRFGLPMIRTGWALEIVIALVVELLDNLTFFLNSVLSFFDSATLKEFS